MNEGSTNSLTSLFAECVGRPGGVESQRVKQLQVINRCNKHMQAQHHTTKSGLTLKINNKQTPSIPDTCPKLHVKLLLWQPIIMISRISIGYPRRIVAQYSVEYDCCYGCNKVMQKHFRGCNILSGSGGGGGGSRLAGEREGERGRGRWVSTLSDFFFVCRSNFEQTEIYTTIYMNMLKYLCYSC